MKTVLRVLLFLAAMAGIATFVYYWQKKNAKTRYVSLYDTPEEAPDLQNLIEVDWAE